MSRLSRKSNWYQQTEALLYNYKSFKIRIMALMQRIDMVKERLMPSMIPAYELRESANYSVSSPVEKAVIERLEGDTIQKLERKIKNLEAMQEIVEVSIDTMLGPEQRRLVDLIYNQEQAWQQTCQSLHIDKNTYYRKKNEIVRVLAWCFGYLPDKEAEKVLGLFIDRTLWENSGNKTGTNRE